MNPIKDLILKYLREGLTAPEQTALDIWLAGPPANRSLFDEINDPVRTAEALAKMDAFHEEEMWARVKTYSSTQKGQAGLKQTGWERETVSRIPIVKRWRWMAAAAILVICGVGGYFGFFHSSKKEMVATQTQAQRFKNDVAPPTGARTTLTLAGGKQIVVDSAGIGTLAEQGNTRIAKLTTGSLSYAAMKEKPSEIVYNTLSTGKGGQTSVTLSDGTKVWLNALSSLRFPTLFAGKERRVEITGEAYFEVAENASLPFKVNLRDGTEINVLGTHFNVNAYEDEASAAITLLEGAVGVTSGAATTTLAPGQQARVDKQGTIKKIDPADTESVIAWKNGNFSFNSQDLAGILRQAARWYDIDVEYQRTVNARFNGEIPRNMPLSDLLKTIELNGTVKFAIEGKKIIVLR